MNTPASLSVRAELRASKATKVAIAGCLGLASLLSVQGATAYWYGSDRDQGGAGDWDATTASFKDSINNGNGSFRTWTAGDAADFGGIAGDVSIKSALTVSQLTFSVGGYKLSGGTAGSLSFTGTAPAITLNSGTSTTFDVPISVSTSAALLINGGGTFVFGRANVFGSATSIDLAGGTALDLNGFTNTVGGFTLTSGSVINSKSGGYLGASSYTLRSGSISAQLAGGASLTMNGLTDASVVTINSQNTYNGSTTIASGTLSLAINAALPSWTNVSITGGTLSIGAGTSQQVQSLNSTGGRLDLAAGSSFGSTGGTMFSNSGTLMGVGAMTSTVSIGNGGIVAPGATGSIGTLSTGSETWAAGGIYNWDVNNANRLPGVNQDLLNITGALGVTATATNKFILNVNNLGASALSLPTASYSWTLATTTGGLSWTNGVALNDLFQVNLNGVWTGWDASNFSVVQNGTSLDLMYAVPEPATYAMLLGAGSLGLVGFRRWRRTRHIA